MIENNIRIPVPDIIPIKKAEFESFAIGIMRPFTIIKPSNK
jgi:hypothetical protein